MKPKRVRHYTDRPRHTECASMPCPECGCCPDCNVCTCEVDFDDYEQLANYVKRIREGERRLCCDELFSLAKTHEQLAKEEKDPEMTKVFEKNAAIYRQHADWLWKHRCF